MSAELHATTGPFKFQAWCDECKDGYNGGRIPAENWQYLHNANHHSTHEAPATAGAYLCPKEG